MPSPERLYSEITGTITGASDEIVFYHGLMDGSGQLAPDHVDLEFTQTQESGGTGGAATDHRLTFTGLPVAAETATIGSAGFSEVWTARAARALPYEFTIGADATATAVNFVAAFNQDTSQNLCADAQAAGVVRIRSARSPGGVFEVGVRDLSAEAEGLTNATWATTSAGAGNVAGQPGWSVITKDTNKAVLRIRGLESTDSLTFRVRAWRMHSMIRSTTPATVVADAATALGSVLPTLTGTDGSVTAGSAVFTSAGATFVTSGVRVGDLLVITEPDATVANIRNNGVYPITAVTATTLTCTTPGSLGFRVTQATLDWSIGFGVHTRGTEYGAANASIAQVPFALPGDTAHSQASPATDVDLPGLAIETAELAAGALADSAAGRAKMATLFFDAGADAANALAKFDDAFWAASATARGKFAAGFLGADATSRALMAAGFFTNTELSSQFASGARPAAARGSAMQARINIGTVPANGETITIGANVFEFRTSTPPAAGTAGRIWVYEGGGVVATARANLVNAINNVVDAPNITYNGAVTETFISSAVAAVITVVSAATAGGAIAASGTATAVSETLGAAADVWDVNVLGVLHGGKAENTRASGMAGGVISAGHITRGTITFNFPFTPTRCILVNRMRPQNEAYVITGQSVVLTTAAGATPNNQAGDVVDVFAWE
ncbi:MAG: hypothetical protein AABY46_04445 [Nitrospirota bacterium]